MIWYVMRVSQPLCSPKGALGHPLCPGAVEGWDEMCRLPVTKVQGKLSVGEKIMEETDETIKRTI